MRELKILEAAGVGAPVLALAALLSLAFSAWVLGNTREGRAHRLAFRAAFVGGIILCVFFALTLSAHAASRAGVRKWVAAEHQTVLLLDMLDRATAQLRRGRAILSVASVLIWAPLAAAVLALWRSITRRCETGKPSGPKVPALVMIGILISGTIVVLSSGGGEPRDEAYAILVPTLVSDLRTELVPGAPEPACIRLEGAVAIMGPEKVSADLPASHDIAATCAVRRLRTGTAREVLMASYLLQLAPTALDGMPPSAAPQ